MSDGSKVAVVLGAMAIGAGIYYGYQAINDEVEDIEIIDELENFDLDLDIIDNDFDL